MDIKVYQTHTEISPYEINSVPKLEKMLSKYDTVRHKYIPIGYYYDNDSKTLYLPKGISTLLLQKFFGSIITPNRFDEYERIDKYNMLYEPRDKIQNEAIAFLTSSDRFNKGCMYSQFGLNLDTGDGKTFCMIYSIMQMRIKTIVITHKQSIKDQWLKSFLTMTDIPENKIFDISGSHEIDQIVNGKISADIYLVNHQTFTSYAKRHGWESIRELFKIMKVGIKVVDESHKFFENSLMIDYFSNVYRSYYLTATFTRSDQTEVKIYKLAYSSLYRFGEETFNYEEKRKHIVLVVVNYHTRPTIQDIANMSSGYGFSNYKFIDYALKEPDDTMMRILEKIINDTKNLKGKTLIISPKVASVEYIAKHLANMTDKSIGTVHSKNSIDENNKSRNSDIISSTIKSIGEGDDIKGLRVLINLEPIGSRALADQLRGRLREYSEDDDTFMFYLVDNAIPECTAFLKRIMPVMKKKCKEIIIANVDI
jgi:superfamily II DNA or RNA helicase